MMTASVRSAVETEAKKVEARLVDLRARLDVLASDMRRTSDLFEERFTEYQAVEREIAALLESLADLESDLHDDDDFGV